MINNWDYTRLVECLAGPGGADRVFATRVRTVGEFQAALERATTVEHGKLCFIEAVIDKDDAAAGLLNLGSSAAARAMRPPAH